jgi:hypothetical protein
LLRRHPVVERRRRRFDPLHQTETLPDKFVAEGEGFTPA